MKKSDTIKSKKEFTNIIKTGEYIKNKEFVIYYKENRREKKRFGIAISTKIGKAVIRNKLKRQTREIITELNYLFKNNQDYIIMIRKGSLEKPFQEKKEQLKKLLKENI